MGGRNWNLLKFIFISLACVATFNQCTGFKSLKLAINFQDAASITPGLFKIERKNVMTLPYNIRLNKIKTLTGSSDAALYAKLEAQRTILGAYDFSKGIAPDLTWTDARMTSWTLALQPICTSSVLNQKFPFPASATAFVEAAYGRSKTATDQSVINGVQATTVTNAQKLEILCYTILSSLEFVAQ